MELLEKRMLQGIEIAKEVLLTPRLSFADIKPSLLPETPGVYVIRHKESGETLYVGRTKNLRQRIYSNHLHGPLSNARLKKYLIEDPDESDITDLKTAKQFLKNNCYVQYRVINDLLERGQIEGLLTYLLNVRYLYEEH